MDREVIFNEQIPAELYVTGINGILTAFISPAPFVPEVGQKYLVVWDGTEYECTAVDGSAQIEGATFIGNTAVIGLQGNNEPFIIGGQRTSPMNVLCLYDTEPATHSVEIYKLAVTDGIVIYNPLGKPVTFGGYNKLEIHRRSGATTIFSEGDAEETTVELDFSEGDMVVKPDREKLFSKVNIPLPENFTAENIKKDVVIAGITGTAQGNKPPVLEMEETTLTFDVTSTTGVYQGEGITYILDNATYTVTFDGVEYCCKGEYPEGLNVGVLGSIGEKNPHIPFLILISVDGEMLINVPDNTATEHTISIKLVDDINSLLNMEETEIVFGEEFFYTMTLPMNKTDVPLKYIIDGAKYTVIWDGISFVCTAWSLTDALEDGTQIKVTGIGNKILTTGEPGAEPFIIADVNGEIRIISLYEEIYGKSSDALNVSVSLNLAGSAEPVFNQPETEIIFSIGNIFGENVPVGITPVDINCIIEGASYNVVFGGDEYTCTAWKYAGPAPDGTDVEIIAIGNTVLTTGVQTAEPFIIGTINGEFTIVNLYGSSSAMVGVTLDVSKDKVLENVPITLDFSAGNQTISAGEGQVVKTAILQKPETLIPENIAEGVDIAGIIGSLAAGGGGNVVCAAGTVTGTGAALTLSHNLGVVPDLIFAKVSSNPTSYNTSKFSILSILGMSTAFGQLCGSAYNIMNSMSRKSSSSASTQTLNLINNSTTGIETTSASETINSANENTVIIGTSSYWFESGKTVYWVAIGGLT